MSSRRGGGDKRVHNHNQTFYRQPQPQTDENLTGNQDTMIQTHHDLVPSSSTQEPYSNSHPQHQKGGPKSRWGTRNRGHKPRFVKKVNKEGKDGDCGGGLVSRSNVDCSNGGTKVESVESGVEGLDPGDGIGEGDAVKRLEELRVSGEEQGSSSRDEIGEDEPVKRLEELRLSVEEFELSPELLSINNQLQEDELLAMESIYGDNICILDSNSGLKCFQVNIHVEVPKGHQITAKFNSSIDQDRRESPNFSYTFTIEYLPPIILTCLLPKSYPSNHAPFFTISVQWLNSAKISDLCCKLDSIWQEQAGLEVIYQWVEWLQGCTLSYLAFDDEIVLGPYGVRQSEDKRAISRSVSPDIDIPFIKSYNDEQRHEDFYRNIQECSICFSEFAGSEFIRLPCQHFFCCKCMKTFSNMHIEEGTVLLLKCPELKCEGTIPPGLLKRVLGEEEFERWESLMLQRTLDSMSDVFYCPRCETACVKDEGDDAQCSKCYYSFCTLCGDGRHVGLECKSADVKLRALQKRQHSPFIKDDQKQREADMINQLLNLREISSSTKQCPSCKMAIYRSEGCNKMVCDNCGQYFCYRCNQKISGYDHFSEGKCELFPAEEIQRWEDRMNGRAMAGQIQAELFANRAHPCPNCGQPNLKVGNNNHILCWACQNHYCYLCRKTVKRSSQHYGPKGCKQHTAG